jgi:arsenite-transporting ATPase
VQIPASSNASASLWGQEVDVYYEAAANWGALEGWLRQVLVWQGADPVLAADLATLPGMDGLAGLIAVLHRIDSGEYDVIVVDCAPTAETLRLLSLPDALRWWVDRATPLERVAARLVRPLLSRLTDAPAPDGAVFAATRAMFERLARVRALLSDPNITSVRLVLTPERMVINETRRTFTALSLYSYPVDAVVCNQLLPVGVVDPHFTARRVAQTGYVAEIEASFSPAPVLSAHVTEREPVGMDMLGRLAEELYGSDDPVPVMSHGRAMTITAEEEFLVLCLPMPLMRLEDLALAQAGDELTVRAGSSRRTIVLPRLLAGRSCVGARFDGGTLRLRFE